MDHILTLYQCFTFAYHLQLFRIECCEFFGTPTQDAYFDTISLLFQEIEQWIKTIEIETALSLDRRLRKLSFLGPNPLQQ